MSTASVDSSSRIFPRPRPVNHSFDPIASIDATGADPNGVDSTASDPPSPRAYVRDMDSLVPVVGLLIGSNIFMTLAWYGHLRFLEHRPVAIAILAAWGVALFEYALQVPANRLGHERLSLPQLRILQEAISLTVFVPIAVAMFGVRFRMDFVWAGLCLVGAVYFAFRGGLGS